MEFTQVVTNRYSCKKYSEKKVEQEKLGAILEAGRLAPTAKNLQEQHVYVIQSEQGLACIDKVTPCRYGAPTVLVVAFDKNNVFTYPGGKRDSGAEDAPDILSAELGLPENEEILMVMDLGYAAEGTGPLPNHSSRKPLSETVTYL